MFRKCMTVWMEALRVMSLVEVVQSISVSLAKYTQIKSAQDE